MPQHRSHMIRAFTLTEVMITMVVSSLVILLAYTALQMMNHYFLRTGQDNELHAERLGMRTIMARDVDSGDSIRFSEDVLAIYHEKEVISWMSDSTVLIRNTGSDEELDIKIFRVGKNVLFISKLPSHRLIEMVGVALAGQGEDTTFFRFFKRYGLEKEVNPSSAFSVIDQ